MEVAQEQRSITSDWLRRHSKLYNSAIRSPFILSIRDGSLDFHLYTRWLEQDFIFIKDFVRYIASILAKAPDTASDEELNMLLDGLNALRQELSWFQNQAVKWGTSLDQVTRHETTAGYCKFLRQLTASNVEYPIALATLWIIEAVYNESFATCLDTDAKTAAELQEACQRWGSQEFKSYCMELKKFADMALEKTSLENRVKAESLFAQVLVYEIEFWSMSYDEKS